MKAHQRVIREQAKPEPDEDKKRVLAASMSNASVREIDYQTAKEVVLKYEWLQNMGSTKLAYGLYFGPYLAGVVCFGATAGTAVRASVVSDPRHK